MTIEADATVRRRLVVIADELEELARDDFAAKHRLNLEADELRLLLAQSSEKDDELLKSWASRAGRKGGHTVDVQAAKAAISSPLEGGGGGL